MCIFRNILLYVCPSYNKRNSVTGTTTGGSAGGAMCTFPFVYMDKTYYDCTGDDYDTFDQLWCGTTPDYNTAEAWGICKGCIFFILSFIIAFLYLL